METYKISVELKSEQAYMWLLALINTLKFVLGEDQIVKAKFEKPEDVVDERGRRAPRVQYRAVDKLDIPACLSDLGAHTVMGKVFAHVAEAGPVTEKDILRAMPALSRKAVQTPLNKLKTSGFIVSEPVGTVK